jgi:hypothetical protein
MRALQAKNVCALVPRFSMHNLITRTMEPDEKKNQDNQPPRIMPQVVISKKPYIVAAVNAPVRTLRDRLMVDLYLFNVILKHRYGFDCLPRDEDIPEDKRYTLDLLRRIKTNLEEYVRQHGGLP